MRDLYILAAHTHTIRARPHDGRTKRPRLDASRKPEVVKLTPEFPRMRERTHRRRGVIAQYSDEA